MYTIKWITALLAALVLLTGCAGSLCEAVPSQPQEDYVHDSNDPSVITVASFPYITNQDTFEKIAKELWAQIEPDVRLEFVDWDCYYSAPSGVDVMMYDALFMSWLAQDGYLRPISLSDIDCLDELLDFTLDAMYDRGKVWGIPNLMCTDCLIYFKDDEAVKNADTVPELFDVIGPRKTDQPMPSDRSEGLLVDLAGYAPYYFAHSAVDHQRDPNQLKDLSYLQDPSSLQIMSLLRDMAGSKMAYPEKDENGESQDYDLAAWFEDGYGRAYLGYSEYISTLDTIADELDVKLISFSANDDTPVFYADVLSISSEVESEEKFILCKKLLNVLSSEEFVCRLIMNDSDTPQYMLPVLKSVWDKIKDEYPIYQTLYSYVQQEENYIFRMGKDANDYLSDAYERLPSYIESYGN